ncbi:MAG: hypothetical protein AAF125_24295, partial [Chloroflexota bacterium]
IQGNDVLATHILAERWLWTLEQAYDDLERINAADMSEKQVNRHGDRAIIQLRLKRALRQLETLDF